MKWNHAAHRKTRHSGNDCFLLPGVVLLFFVGRLYAVIHLVSESGSAHHWVQKTVRTTQITHTAASMCDPDHHISKGFPHKLLPQSYTHCLHTIHTHCSHFCLGKGECSIQAITVRLCNSFFPQSIRYSGTGLTPTHATSIIIALTTNGSYCFVTLRFSAQHQSALFFFALPYSTPSSDQLI